MLIFNLDGAGILFSHLPMRVCLEVEPRPSSSGFFSVLLFWSEPEFDETILNNPNKNSISFELHQLLTE